VSPKIAGTVPISFNVHIDLMATNFASAAELVAALKSAIQGSSLGDKIGSECRTATSVFDIESSLVRNNYPTLAPKYTGKPTAKPSMFPSPRPQQQPTPKPTMNPVAAPTLKPTKFPTLEPTEKPVMPPTLRPTNFPKPNPTNIPISAPTPAPIDSPTPYPKPYPSQKPIGIPTLFPVPQPTLTPFPMPTPMSMVSLPLSLKIMTSNSASLTRACVFAAVSETVDFIDEVIQICCYLNLIYFFFVFLTFDFF